MIGRLFKGLFDSKKASEETSMSARKAAATLLVEAALTDGVYADVESDRIEAILKSAFDMDGAAARALRDEAEDEAEQSIDSYKYTSIVKTLPYEQRLAIVEGLYYVSLADGDRCKFEDAFIRHVASLLHVEDVSRAEARQAAEARSRSAN